MITTREIGYWIIYVKKLGSKSFYVQTALNTSFSLLLPLESCSVSLSYRKKYLVGCSTMVGGFSLYNFMSKKTAFGFFFVLIYIWKTKENIFNFIFWHAETGVIKVRSYRWLMYKQAHNNFSWSFRKKKKIWIWPHFFL